MKKLVIVIFIIFGAFLTFSLYRTFAYDTSIVEETPSTTDLEYTFKIGNSSIKQITIDSGETKYYDVVLGNPNPAKINYGVYYEMVNPSTKPDGFSIEYTSKSTGESTGKIDKESTITLNLVLTNTSSSSVTVKLGTVAGYVNGGELALESGQEFIPKKSFPKATELVESLNDNSTGDSGSGIYKVHHDAISADSSATGEIISDTDDYRYYGASPNNYICLDKNSDGTCEDKHLYRIIGSMREDSDKVYKVKVIKATPLTDGTTSEFSWDCTNVSSSAKLLAPEMTVCNRRANVWSGKEADATIMQLLNGIWLNNGVGNYYNNSSKATVLNFTNYGLSNNAKKLINLKSRYYLGGFESATKKTIEAYIAERENVTSNGNSQYWDGMVGLMYLSDIGYVSGENCANNISLNTYDDDCFNKNWIYERKYGTFTITPIAASDIVWKNDYNIYMIQDGRITDVEPAETVLSVFPVFYLKSNVVITSGTGTEQDPYLVQ